MLSSKETWMDLERRLDECKAYWLMGIKEDVDEREALRRAFEWDIIEIYNFNDGCLHEWGVPHEADKLDHDTIIKFFKTKCQELYGDGWEEVYKTYNIKGE